MIETWVIAIGDRLFGPFPSEQDATEFAEQYMAADTWRVVQVEQV